MKRVLAFSLYGTLPLYLAGAIRNLKLIPDVYPGWTARVYVSEEISGDLVDEMRALGAEVIRKSRSGLIDGMFWRFLPACEPDIDAMVVRDVDSRVTHREFAAVSQWIESGKTIHILRDHPLHKVVMLGGMWGCRSNALPDINQLIADWKLWGKKGLDQEFLRDIVYPRFRNDCLVHSEFYAYGDEDARPLPLPRNGGEFVGCVYDTNRDSLTDQQHAEYAKLFEHVTLRRLPASQPRSKSVLVAKQYLRNIRQLFKLPRAQTA